LRADHDVLYAHGQELAMETVAKGPGLVATMNFLGKAHLLASELQELRRRHLLGRLRGGRINLAHHPVTVGVDVNAQYYAREL
jgi:hypothetical protein